MGTTWDVTTSVNPRRAAGSTEAAALEPAHIASAASVRTENFAVMAVRLGVFSEGDGNPRDRDSAADIGIVEMCRGGQGYKGGRTGRAMPVLAGIKLRICRRRAWGYFACIVPRYEHAC